MFELKDFGKDHWSVFAYAETCAVDSHAMDLRRLRFNSVKRYPLKSQPYGPNEWKDEYGTRLKDGSTPDLSHDDIDCLDDLETLGLIITGTVVNLTVVFTELGQKVAAELRQHKMNGGQFREFESDILKREVQELCQHLDA